MLILLYRLWEESVVPVPPSMQTLHVTYLDLPVTVLIVLYRLWEESVLPVPLSVHSAPDCCHLPSHLPDGGPSPGFEVSG